MNKIIENESTIILVKEDEAYQLWYDKGNHMLYCGASWETPSTGLTALGEVSHIKQVLPTFDSLKQAWEHEGYTNDDNYKYEEAFFLLVNNHLVDYWEEQLNIEMLDRWQCYGSFMEDGLLDLDPVYDRDEIVAWIREYFDRVGEEVAPTRGLSERMISWARGFCK